MKETPTTARARVKRWQKENKAAFMEKQRAYRARHPERYKARMAVQSALRNGTMTRPTECECGSAKPEAHHEDYSRPLDVTWLCRSCHHKTHGGRLRAKTVTVAAVFALAVAATAAASTQDNYGTSRTESARMTHLVYRTFGTGYAGRCMVRIMWRESGGNPRAANYHDSNGGSYGLLQLNGAHRWATETLAQFQQRMWNPTTHLAAAKRLYDGSGFAPWGGCPS